MSDWRWEPAAEFFLRTDERPEPIYCLCSRVFVSTKDESAPAQDTLEEDSGSDCDYTLQSNKETKTESNKHNEDPEDFDNCSFRTTELDTDQSVDGEVIKGIPSSDSGTDLTECGKTECDTAFLKYWHDNEEQIIINSWVEQYSAYINPEFIQQNPHLFPNGQIFQNEPGPSSDPIEEVAIKVESETKSIEKKEPETNFNLTKIHEDEILTKVDYHKRTDLTQRNQMLIRNLSGSDSMDRLGTDISAEGWNPLSPSSAELETETERLLNSRCGSHASSSVRTVDSLTNVTRMTVSSIDLSDSSKTSDSISSVSSVQSSLSSTTSEEMDDNPDFDQQWQNLWKKNYEEQYVVEYNRFVDVWYGNVPPQSQEDFPTKPPKSKSKSSRKSKLKKSTAPTSQDLKDNQKNHTKFLDSVGKLLVNFKDTLTFDPAKTEDPPDEDNPDPGEDDYVDQNHEEFQLMKALGLPTSFFNQMKPKKDKKVVRKYSKNSQIKAAFEELGLTLEVIEDSLPYQGSFSFITKDSAVEMSKRPRHIRFGDDGEIFEVPQTPPEFKIKIPGVSFEKPGSADSNATYCIRTPSESEESFSSSLDSTTEDIPETPKRKAIKRKCSEMLDEQYSPTIHRYYKKRFSLFSKYNQGIKLDNESWYSVTPEKIAKFQAERCKCDIIIDGFCGVGGNAIQFAMTCKKVIAIDIDSKKIEMAKHNAGIYGVADKIEFICGDFFQLAPSLKADVVYLSPPWGGPCYLKQETYDLESMLLPKPFSEMLESATQISKNICTYIPRTSNMQHILDHASSMGSIVEIAKNEANKKVKALTVFYNDLVKSRTLLPTVKPIDPLLLS